MSFLRVTLYVCVRRVNDLVSHVPRFQKLFELQYVNKITTCLVRPKYDEVYSSMYEQQ